MLTEKNSEAFLLIRIHQSSFIIQQKSLFMLIIFQFHMKSI